MFRSLPRLQSTTCFFLGTMTLALVPMVSAQADGPAVPAGSASAGGGAAGAPGQPGFLSMIVPFALMFAVLYFLMIRPQQKKMKEQQSMLGNLKHGDEVITTSGIIGRITGLTDKVVTLEIADNVRVKVIKSQISQVVKGQIQ